MNTMICGNGLAVFSMTFLLGISISLVDNLIENPLIQTNKGISGNILFIEKMKSSELSCLDDYGNVETENLFKWKNIIEAKIRMLEFTIESPSALNTYKEMRDNISKQIEKNIKSERIGRDVGGMLCVYPKELCTEK